MSPTLLERLRSWTEAGIAASPYLARRELCESADEIERLRVELIKAWDYANELRQGVQNLQHLIAAAINVSPPKSHEAQRPSAMNGSEMNWPAPHAKMKRASTARP
ncbi:MAG TPA: hypothetical protein VFM21_08855 [Terriglobia bacterium]|nr:hypothetical protein [Terriglobia bacterium]